MMSLRKRKIIFWSVLIVLGAGLLFWWISGLQKKVDNFQAGQFMQELNVPEIELPSLPEIPEETLETLKESLEEDGQQ